MQPNLGWSGGWQSKLAILLFFSVYCWIKEIICNIWNQKVGVYIGKEGILFGRKKINFLCVAIES